MNPSNHDMTYLALGDSYTIGEGVTRAETFPEQLASLIRKEREEELSVTIIATTGWTTGDLIAGIGTNPPKPPYDLVTLLIGVNNQYRGLDPLQYQQQFDLLLGQAIAFAGNDPSRVIVVSIPDYGVTPFAADRDPSKISREIDLFNSINNKSATSMKVAWVDVTHISRQAAGDSTLLAPDGLHPSGTMYSMWAEQMVPVALEILK